LLSNGCHWVDHFLFLNGFSKETDLDVYVARDKTINCSVVLENGAVFTMVLTDRGSERLGVQNHVELRTATTTAKIVNDGLYVSESVDRVLRKTSVNRMDSYARMYRTIAERISKNQRGDTLKTIVASSRVILELERRASRLLERLGSLQPPSKGGQGAL
jgi:hypothetical protein